MRLSEMLAQRDILRDDLAHLKRMRDLHRKRKDEFDKTFAKAANYQSSTWKGVKGSFDYRAKQHELVVTKGNNVYAM